MRFEYCSTFLIGSQDFLSELQNPFSDNWDTELPTNISDTLSKSEIQTSCHWLQIFAILLCCLISHILFLLFVIVD